MSRIAVVLALAIFIGGCSKDPEVAKREFAASGDAYFQQKKYAEAVIEYRNAIQQDPRFGEARLKLADTYMELRQPAEAIREYIRAADLLPDNHALQIKAGRMLMLAGQFEDAQARAERVLSANPKYVDAHLLKAGALAGMKNFDEAVTQVESAIEEEPGRSGAYVDLASLEMARGNLADAEAAFKKAIEADPKSIDAKLALANFYWLAKRPADAETLLKEIYTAEPNNMQANRALAAFYIGSGKAPAAEPHLKALADISKDGHSKVGLALYYLGMNRGAEGKALLESVAAGEGKAAAAAKTRLAALAASGGKRPEAYRLLDEALQKDKTHALALLSRGEMLLQDRKTDEALAAVAPVEDTNATKHLIIGRIRSARNEWREATTALNEAIRLSPRLVRAQMELARVQLNRGETDAALATAQTVVKLQPRSSEAQLLLARAYIAKRDAAGAEAPLRALSEGGAKSAAVHSSIGLQHLLKKNPTEARAAFERALAMNPNHMDALSGLMALDMQAGKPAAVRERIDRRLANSPKDPNTLMFAARTYFALRDYTAAERALRTVIDVDPALLSAYGQLGQVFAAQNRMDDARAEFQRLSEKRPNEVAPPTLVAMIYQSQGKNDQAKTWYEKALAIDSRAAVPANNLAWLSVEMGGNLDTALQLAQTAKAGLPNVPEVDDTLGWIYYKKGLAPLAIRSFEASIEKDPKNAAYHYHLGLAYSTNQEWDKARKSLEQALSLKLNPQDAAGAQKALASLKG